MRDEEWPTDGPKAAAPRLIGGDLAADVAITAFIEKADGGEAILTPVHPAAMADIEAEARKPLRDRAAYMRGYRKRPEVIERRQRKKRTGANQQGTEA